MPQIPFLYVNITAFCCFLILLTAALSSKKTPAVWAFIAVLADCILWSGGSILMRLQMWPSMEFWYYVSLVALFSMACMFYLFVHTFYCEKKIGPLLVCILGTLLLLPGTISGYFLAPPVPMVLENGSTVFIYNMDWHIVFPFIVVVTIIVLTVILLLKLVRKHGIHSPGLLVLIWGGLIILVGNLLQVAIPGNIFPYDALAGVIFAILLMFSLYKRRMFRLQLLISKSILFVMLGLICVIMSLYLITPFQKFAVEVLNLNSDIATALTAILFGLILYFTYGGIKKACDAILILDEQQGKEIQSFTNQVSRTLSTVENMEILSKAILEQITVEKVFVCLREDRCFVSKYCSSPLAANDIAIDIASPMVSFMQGQEPYVILREFESTPLYLSTWESEKDMIRRNNIRCISALKDGDEIIGLVLLSSKEEDKEFSYNDMAFLETVCSVSSIAMKNASLYEQMFREARIDSLTGAYNYRYFQDEISKAFEECRGDSLCLMYIDVDDFKLYNQLYGVEQGDQILIKICDCIRRCMGNNKVFRTGGKVFAALLPHEDVHHAGALADEVRMHVKEISHREGVGKAGKERKELSVSIGICVYPYAASGLKELMDNADLATFNAKQNGKDCVSVFKGTHGPDARSVIEKTDRLIETAFKGEKADTTLAMITALTAAIDAKDHYTYFHSKNVARYATCLGVAAGLNDEQLRTIYAAGLLHDVGKISIPESVLNKNASLTDEEFNMIRDHVNNSIEMIKRLPGMDYIVPAVLGHHERPDGKGYPRGIAGEDIPITARCLAVADVFDAMVTDRPYRKGKPLSYAIEQLLKGAGTQFDEELAKLFVKLLEDQEIVLSTREQDSKFKY